MQQIRTIIIALFAVGTASANPVQWTSGSGGNNHYYDVISSVAGVSWTTAEANSLALSGYLVTITSAAENTFVTGLVQAAGGRFFIGANDTAVTGTYRWIDGPEAGQALVYSNFAAGQPDNVGVEHYVETFGTAVACCGVGTWNNLPNAGSTGSGYVIEYNTQPTPEPSTALMALGALLAAGVTRRRQIHS